MKATGIIRRVDDLGRIVLPKELRQTMGIRTGDPMEIYTDADNIILRKYVPGCAFCGSVDGVRHIHDVPMCAICANNMQMLYRTAEGRDSKGRYSEIRAPRRRCAATSSGASRMASSARPSSPVSRWRGGCFTSSSLRSASHETSGGRIYVTVRAGHATPE